MTLLIVDVDRFKEINDTYGHNKGDFVLKSISDVLRASIEKAIKAWGEVEYHCQKDADDQLIPCLSTRLKYHLLTGEVLRMEKVKRRPGRPSKTETLPTEIYYTCALLQRRIRVKLAEEKTPLRLYGKDFYSPTGKTILEQFDHVLVIEYEDPVTLKTKK